MSDTEIDINAPAKKKHKKEHKHKHKKHGLDKNDKYKKHKKHKKHKHKHSSVIEKEISLLNVENDCYTPVLSPRSPKTEVEKTTPQNKHITIVTTPDHTDNGKIDTNDISKECVQLESDANNVVEYVTSGLLETRSLEVISSESEDGTPEVECDSDAIDVSVIEADMDLEELMKQKELLQAEIARAFNAELNNRSPVNTRENGKKEKLDEVILLDDSSNDAEIHVKKPAKKYSQSRERRVIIEHKDNSNKNEKIRRSYSKERTYKEIEKYKSERLYSKDNRLHDHRSFEKSRDMKDLDSRYKDLRRSRSRERNTKLGVRDTHLIRDRSYDRERSRGRDLQSDKRRTQGNSKMKYSSNNRSSKSYDKIDRGRYRERERSRGRNRSKERRNKDRHKSRSEKYDKYQGSLSEGLKQIISSSSDSDHELDIDINDDEEDEQQIIERRRKQREELLKVG